MSVARTDALAAALGGVALADRSGLARLRGTGPDLLDLLQRLGTGDVRGLARGEGRRTVLTTPKGRIVAHLFVHVLEDAVLLVGTHGAAPAVRAHVLRYTFAEQVHLEDVTARTRALAIVGPAAGRALETAGLPAPPALGALASTAEGVALTVLGHDGSSPDGFLIVCEAADAASTETMLQAAVRRCGGETLDDQGLTAWEILRGHGTAAEYNEDHNPLEAGLTEAVSFSKGCYVGQEVVARLRTYDKVARALVALVVRGAAPAPVAGTPVTADGRAVGLVTRSVLPPGGHHAVALAYLKRDAASPGARVLVGDAEAEVRPLPLTEIP